MMIGLASPRVASSLDDGLARIERCLSDASARGAEIVCFPEAYLPGLRGQDFAVFPFDQAEHDRAIQAVSELTRTHSIATVLGIERIAPQGRQIAACVIDARGQVLGYQTKNQLDPTEDQFYVPGTTRRRSDGRPCVAPGSSSIPIARGHTVMASALPNGAPQAVRITSRR